MAKADTKQLTKRLNIPTYKPLQPQNVQVRPFKVNKEFVLTELDTGSIEIMKGIQNTSSLFDSASFITNSNGTYQKQIYDSVKHLYYEFAGEPIHTFGITSTTRIFKRLYSTVTVLGLNQNNFGEAIKPGTITITNSGSTILDDFDGNLYDNDESSSFAISKSDYTIGNVFYEHGNIVLTDNGRFASSSLSYQDIVTSSFELTYKNIHTIYEWQISCNVGADEFGFTYNPTILSSSVSESFGPELITTWTDGTTFGYDTAFISTGSKVIFASHTQSSDPGSGSRRFGGAVSEVLHVTESKRYHVNFILNSISGSRPAISFRNNDSGAGVGVSNAYNSVNGVNSAVLTPTSTGDFFLQIQVSPGHGSFSTKEISLKEQLPVNDALSNTIRGELTSGSDWSPYITSIGLYDDIHIEPLVVAKLARPIKKDRDLAFNFIVRFDL